MQAESILQKVHTFLGEKKFFLVFFHSVFKESFENVDLIDLAKQLVWKYEG